MTGLLRKAMLLACSGVLAAPSAMAAIPSPADSSIPCGINLVGQTGGVVDARGLFTVIIRDLAATPIPGSSVVIDFSNCKVGATRDDIRVCSVQPYAGVTAVCTAPVAEITGVTDGGGSLTMSICGGATTVATAGVNNAAAGFKCATLYADGVNMGTVNVGAYDQNGGGGVNPADISLFFGDSFSGPFEGRSDYNCSNSVNVADLSLIFGASLGGGSFSSCTAYCF